MAKFLSIIFTFLFGLILCNLNPGSAAVLATTEDYDEFSRTYRTVDKSPPRVEAYDSNVYVEKLGDKAIFQLTIFSGVTPDLRWLVANNMIPGNYSTGRIKTSIIPLEHGTYDCRLIIDSVQKEDLGLDISVFVTNYFGSKTFMFYLWSKEMGCSSPEDCKYKFALGEILAEMEELLEEEKKVNDTKPKLLQKLKDLKKISGA